MTPERLTTIIIVGQCQGTYKNQQVEKEFECKVLVSARPNGTVIVHNLAAGVRPICYLDEGADISISRNVKDAELELIATTEDGQQLTLQFTEVMALQGIPIEKQSDSLSISILKCVFDMGGKYGRMTIAQVLTGSNARKILAINIPHSGTHGIAKDSSTKDILCLIDWLIEENYLAFATDSEFPIIVITGKGLNILAEGEMEITPEPEKHVCTICGSPAEGARACTCTCPQCGNSCYDDITLTDHGKCKDCHREDLEKDNTDTEDIQQAKKLMADTFATSPLFRSHPHAVTVNNKKYRLVPSQNLSDKDVLELKFEVEEEK